MPKPVRLYLMILLGLLAIRTSAITRVYSPDVLKDMGTMTREAFDAKWPANEIQDGNLPNETGFWVTYRHLNLTILVGPYEDRAVAENALSQMDTYRAVLMMGQAQKFGSSTVALLENRPSPGKAAQSKLPPGPLRRENEVTDQVAKSGDTSSAETSATPQPDQKGGVGFGMITTPSSILETLPEVYPPFFGRALRSEEDLSKRFPPAGNQAPQNACAGWAVGYAMKSYHEAVEEGWSTWSFWTGANLNYTFSPAYVYNQINGGSDEGAMLPVCLSLVQTSGVCRWPRMPFQPTDFTRQPSDIAHRDAARYRIDFFGIVPNDSLDTLKGFLAGGFPLVVGLMTDPDFESLKKDNVWSSFDPSKGSPHAVIVVGYDDRKKAFKVFNSWGRNWGRKGYGWIAYDLWPEVALEVFVAKDAKNDARAPVWDRKDFTVDIQNTKRTPSGGIQLAGSFDVPEEYKAEFSVVVVFEDEKGKPLAGRESYTTVKGQLGAKSTVQGFSWDLELPGNVLSKTDGSRPYAKAILYLDDFGLTTSERVRVGP